MKAMVFASRNAKEILRDPVNIGFGLGFPIIILLLLSAIQANVPVKIFEINKLAPGIAVFGFSFISLFSATLLAKDKSSSFLMRLFASPMRASDFIIGYALPMFPMALAQSGICFFVAAFLGMTLSINVVYSVIVLIPAMVFFVSLGLLLGTLFNDKQVGAVCGALLTNLTAWLSGTWFDLNLVGGGFKRIAYVLPFANAVDAGKAALVGNGAAIWHPLAIVVAYAVGVSVVAVVVFRKRMHSDAA